VLLRHAEQRLADANTVPASQTATISYAGLQSLAALDSNGTVASTAVYTI